MKRFFVIFFCIAAISWGVFYSVSVSHDREADAVGGVIDLRQASLSEADLTLDNVYALGGEWEFYWGRLYEPKDFAGAASLEGKALIPVPSPWNRSSGYSRAGTSHGYPRFGYGTYRLTLLTPEDTAVMMYVPEILTSAAVWVNGEKVFSAGQVGTDKDSFSPYAMSGIVALPASSTGRFDIVVQASNFERLNGGIRHAFRVGLGGMGGNGNPLARSLMGRWFILAGVVSVFFFVGVCYAALFFLRRGDTRGSSNLIYIVFAAGCLLTGLRLLVNNDAPAQFFLRSAALNTQLGLIYWIVTALHSAIVVIFPIMAFELKPHRAVIRAIAVMLGLPVVLLMILPVPYNNFAAVLYILPFTAITILAAKSLSLERIRNRPYLGLYFISLLFFTVWGPFVNFPANAYFFAGYSLNSTFLTLAQFVMLSQEYAEARRKTRELEARNDFYHKMAHDLLTPLTVVSTSVQVADMIPAKAPALLKQSQAEIMKMAGMINDALNEAREKDRQMERTLTEPTESGE